MHGSSDDDGVGGRGGMWGRYQFVTAQHSAKSCSLQMSIHTKKTSYIEECDLTVAFERFGKFQNISYSNNECQCQSNAQTATNSKNRMLL